MKFRIFDLETIPHQNLPADCIPQFDPADVKLGNTKDPEKVNAKIIEARDSFDASRDKTMSLDPALCQLCTFSSAVYDSDTGDIRLDESRQLEGGDHDDFDVVHHGWSMINAAYTERMPVVSFNGLSFDLPVLWFRMMAQDVPASIPAYRNLTQRYANKNHYDLMQILAGWDRQRWHGLDFYAALFGVGRKTMSGADVYPAYKAGEYDKIKTYCEGDVLTLAHVFKAVYPWIVLEETEY